MPTRLNTNFPRPTDLDEFETMVRDICALEWGDPHTERHGRRGQKQHGVDVYGRPVDRSGVYRGAQCKLRTKGDQLTEQEIEAEVAEARNFPHHLDSLILVTDAPRDKNAQILVDQISERELANSSFKVAIWFWDNVTERLAAHRHLIVKYYPEFYANLTTLPIVERLIDKPLQVISISSELAISQPVDDLLRLRGIRVLGVGRRGNRSPDSHVDEDDPDGILCFCSLSDAEVEDESGGLLRLAGNLQSRLQKADTACPAFALLPAGLSNAFTQAFERLGGSARRIQVFSAEQPPGESADDIFRAVFRYGHTRRGGLSTIDIAARTRSGRPSAVLLDMDWQSRLNTTLFPSPVEWQEIFVPALTAVRSQILSESDRSRIQFSSQLPLPAAFALGFNFNIRVARIGVWARRTGGSDFKQQLWLSDAQCADIDFPVEWYKGPPDRSNQSTIVELTSYGSIHASVAYFAEQSGLNPDIWVEIELETKSGKTTNIEESTAVAYANHVGRTIRNLNEQGVVDVHLFARIPSPLAMLIGQRLLACGRIHLYWFNNPSYQFAFTLS